MIYNLLRKIKNFLIKNIFLSKLLAKIYVICNYFYKKKKIEIFRKSNFWIHKIDIGYIPSNKPIFDPEKHAKQNFDIFFENYSIKKGDTILELGAGTGCETLVISKIVGIEGKVISVEPFDKVYNFLKTTVKLNNLTNVVTVNAAIYENSDGIGFSSDINDWLVGKIDKKSKKVVQSICLDDLIKQLNINKINFCKINIEGAERYITKNSDLFFSLCENIAIECHDFLEDKEYKTFNLIREFLLSKKYKLKFNDKRDYPWQQYYIYASK